MRIDPALVHVLQGHRVEIVPALPAALATADQAGRGQDVEMAHDGDPRELEVGGDITRDPRPVAQQIPVRAPSRIGEGPPDRAAISLELGRHIARTAVQTRNASITYLIPIRQREVAR